LSPVSPCLSLIATNKLIDVLKTRCGTGRNDLQRLTVRVAWDYLVMAFS
jgi:hypothetical protein